MNKNESSSLYEKKEIESKGPIENINSNNLPNLSPSISNILNSQIIEKEEEEIDEFDDIDNLKYKEDNNNNYNIKHKLDSGDSPINSNFKFSIDMPNVSKQRLHEYLNNDLLNALDVSPSISNLNNGYENIKINENNINNINNNPDCLFGFSLYHTKNDNNLENQNTTNNLTDSNKNEILLSKNNIDNNNLTHINNINNNIIINSDFNSDNNDSDNKIKEKLKIDNSSIFIPKQLRNIDIKNNKNIKPKTKKNKTKNKFNNNKINNNYKNEGKQKKLFEVRAGDWLCSKCNNLNFAFRYICNRCGLPKELSVQQELMNQEIYDQYANYQMMDDFNQNFI